MKLLMFVREDFAFLQHRLPIAIAAQQMGYEVNVLTVDNGRFEEITQLGFYPHNIVFPFVRLNLFKLPLTILSFLIVIWKIKPNIVHLSSTYCCALGAFAGLFYRRVPTIIAFTGLGYLFTSNKFLVKIGLRLATPLLALLWNRPMMFPVFQNSDDAAELRRLNLSLRPETILPGAGVDINKFQPLQKLAHKCFVVGCAARLLKDKGIHDAVEAMKELQLKRSHITLVIAGVVDPVNPTSFTNKDIDAWGAYSNIEFVGLASDMVEFWQKCDAALLPSYREGMPKALLEAAASALPIVATDVPGCRDLVVDGVNGFLVDVANPSGIAAALLKLSRDRDFCNKAGAESRQLILRNEMDIHSISRKYACLLKDISRY